MGALKQHVREQILLEMYASLNRQAQCIMESKANDAAAARADVEKHLQQNQRKRFELFVEEAE